MNITSWILIVILLILAVGGCSSSKDTKNALDVDPDMVIRIVNNGPQALGFELTIYGGGKVEYEGYPHDYPEHIYVQGARNAEISHMQLEQLVMAINESSFFSFEDFYTKGERDGVTTDIMVNMNGQSKHVGWDGFSCGKYYDEDNVEIIMPEFIDDIDPWEKAEISLCYLQSAIEKVAYVKQWVESP